jgi:DMSO/TMAO reductase YedYZ molybdopterin-dependent catalytic subunit
VPERRYGRATFLGVSALGLSSLAWADPVWRRLSGIGSALPASIAPSGWRIYTVAASMPRFDAATWRLEVGGLVERPLSLSIADLRALPRAEQTSDFHCVTGWSVEGVRWGGVRLADLLDAAGPLPEARAVRVGSLEQVYQESLTLEQARLVDTMLAYDMDGAPLRPEHGLPLRMVVPQLYGYKGSKWVTRLELVPRHLPGYWEYYGYDLHGWIDRDRA